MQVSLSNNKTVAVKAKSVISKSASGGAVASLEKQKKALVKQKTNYVNSAGKNGTDPKTVKAKVAAFDSKIKNIDKEISAAKAKARGKSTPNKSSSKTSDEVVKNIGVKAGSKSSKSMSKMDTLKASLKQLKALSKSNKPNTAKDALINPSKQKINQQINSYKKNASFSKEQDKSKKNFSIVL